MEQRDMFSQTQTTLVQARADLMSKLDEGAKCPCCDQHAQRYRRHINAGMARALILMSRSAGPNGLVDIKTLDVRGGDYAKLRYWGLIASAKDPGERLGARSGLWRVTDHGHRFVQGTLGVMDTALVYADECLRLTGKPMTIRDALGTKFDYDKLMEGA